MKNFILGVVIVMINFHCSSFVKKRQYVQCDVPERIIRLTGFCKRSIHQNYSAISAGKVDWITEKKEGDVIFPGELIVKIDEKKANEIYLEAKKKFNYVTLTYLSAKALYEEDGLSRESFEKYHEIFKEEEEIYNQKMYLYRNMIIYASQFGKILKIFKSINDKVREKETIILLEVEGDIYVEVEISEELKSNILSKKLKIEVEDSANNKIEGELIKIHDDFKKKTSQLTILMPKKSNFVDKSFVKVEISY